MREALVRLEGAGLVVTARHKGAMVRSLTREDIDQGRDVLLVGFDQVGSVEGLFESFAS